MDLEEKILLLAILKKEESETLTDILLKLEATKLFSLKEGKKLIKKLKNEQLVNKDLSLSIKGELLAKKIEKEFKI